jgi:hypothetical protein
VSYELYEVWAEDAEGHQELIDTTRSRSHAMQLAQQTLAQDNWVVTTVYLETEDGDLETVKEFS